MRSRCLKYSIKLLFGFVWGWIPKETPGWSGKIWQEANPKDWTTQELHLQYGSALTDIAYGTQITCIRSLRHSVATGQSCCSQQDHPWGSLRNTGGRECISFFSQQCLKSCIMHPKTLYLVSLMILSKLIFNIYNPQSTKSHILLCTVNVQVKG